MTTGGSRGRKQLDLSTQQLVQFLSDVSRAIDAPAAKLVAAERAAAALEAEVAAVIVDGAVSAVGFPRGNAPMGELLDVIARRSSSINIPGIGPCPAMAAPLNDARSGHMIVARRGDGFGADESNLLRGMAQTLHLVLVMLRTLDGERVLREQADAQATENAGLLHSLRDRHALLEQLVTIQRAISRRAPLDQVLDSIVSGAHELLRSDLASLCLIGDETTSGAVVVASRGPHAAAAHDWQLGIAPYDVSAEAVRTATLVVETRPGMCAMAAPVHEGATPVGALVVGSISGNRVYSAAEKATLSAFAQQVSLAMTDSRTLEEMRKAHHDSLTGLASRRLFMERLQSALVQAERDHSLTAVLFLDLDRFKMVNDTLGHAAGDELLVQVASRILPCLRSVDLAARLGGDEFAVLLEGITELTDALNVGDRVRSALRAPVTIQGQQVFIDASVGLVTHKGGTERDAESMLRDADIAMYDAKRSGSGRTTVFVPQMLTRFTERMNLETDLRRALANDEFELHYQPITHVESGEIAGFEALLRWNHPVRGPVPPLTFIEVAEETGLIRGIGELVLRRACREAASWRDLSHDGSAPYISVNLSGRQLQGADLPGIVEGALAEYGLDPTSLVLEITESVLLEGPGVQSRLHQLKEAGVRLAVDDFGAGYSSLNYLRSFPIDLLKIDKSFVDGIADDPAAVDLIRAIIGLGTALRLDTIAEGVETRAQRDVLVATDCRFAQGFLFSRPLPATAARQLLVLESPPLARSG